MGFSEFSDAFFRYLCFFSISPRALNFPAVLLEYSIIPTISLSLRCLSFEMFKFCVIFHSIQASPFAFHWIPNLHLPFIPNAHFPPQICIYSSMYHQKEYPIKMNAEFDLPSNRNVSISTSKKNFFLFFIQNRIKFMHFVQQCDTIHSMVWTFHAKYHYIWQNAICIIYFVIVTTTLFVEWLLAYSIRCMLSVLAIRFESSKLTKKLKFDILIVLVSLLYFYDFIECMCGRWALCVLSAFDSNGVSIIPLVVFVCHEHH